MSAIGHPTDHAPHSRASVAQGPHEPGGWRWPALYCVWAAVAIAISIAIAGLNAESVTRLLVLAFLGIQLATHRIVVRAAAVMPRRVRFVVMGTLLAAVVEGFHMISTPVFLSLRVDRTTASQVLVNYAIDLAFTIPAYLVVFSVIWWGVTRYAFTTWRYVFVVGLAQALGDGGLFYFAANPAMLVFLPYPMTNYHAINVVPFLAVHDDLPRSPRGSGTLLVTAAIIATYLVCGAVIRVVGGALGYV